jgi:hypothetical protein
VRELFVRPRALHDSQMHVFRNARADPGMLAKRIHRGSVAMLACLLACEFACVRACVLAALLVEQKKKKPLDALATHAAMLAAVGPGPFWFLAQTAPCSRVFKRLPTHHADGCMSTVGRSVGRLPQ